MKKQTMSFLVACLMTCGSLFAADNKAVGVVNFKSCVEKSKMGKQEQATFEALKKQMETVLEEKEKTLSEIANKFNDPDYLDSLTPEAEAELKHKFRTLSNELSQQQNQYYQMLSQANFKVVQKLTDTVATAAKNVAKKNNLDFVCNDEACFFYKSDFDISDKIIAEMDVLFEKETKENKPLLP